MSLSASLRWVAYLTKAVLYVTLSKRNYTFFSLYVFNFLWSRTTHFQQDYTTILPRHTIYMCFFFWPCIPVASYWHLILLHSFSDNWPFPGSVLLCSQHHFFTYTQIWHSWKCTPLEEKSWKIVNIVLSKMKCTPQELSVLLTTGDAYFLHYLNEKYID